MRRLAPLVYDLGGRALNAGIPVVTPTVQAELPHDRSAFTQGLAYVDGKLAESTGLEHASSVRRLCAETGELEQSRELPGHYGEGIAYTDGKLVQLTWKSQKAIVYRWPDLEVIDEYRYEGEGWGLASIPGGFLMTDGSEKLIVRDGGFRITDTIRVTRKRYRMRWLNDLTYAKDCVYVNRLGREAIYEVSLSTGRVMRIIDCHKLVRRAKPSGSDALLNGIAFDADRDEFYVTGKRWPVIFRVTIPPRTD